MNTQLKICFYENQKAQNEEISRHVRQQKKTETKQRADFESERVRFYGDNWLNILFPNLSK